MNNQLLKIKIVSRLNKLGSFDYDNIEDWQLVEAINKVQTDYSRREAKKGEEDIQSIDNLQILVREIPLGGTNLTNYFETVTIPTNFLAYKKISCIAHTKDCKESKKLKVYRVEESNIDDILRDPNMNPSFEWLETIATSLSNRLRIYTNDKFKIESATLTYYRKPAEISIAGSVDPSIGQVSGANVECEFKDDIVELLIDEAAALLAGDIESMNQYQRNLQAATRQE